MLKDNLQRVWNLDRGFSYQGWGQSLQASLSKIISV